MTDSTDSAVALLSQEPLVRNECLAGEGTPPSPARPARARSFSPPTTPLDLRAHGSPQPEPRLLPSDPYTSPRGGDQPPSQNALSQYDFRHGCIMTMKAPRNSSAALVKFDEVDGHITKYVVDYDLVVVGSAVRRLRGGSFVCASGVLAVDVAAILRHDSWASAIVCHTSSRRDTRLGHTTCGCLDRRCATRRTSPGTSTPRASPGSARGAAGVCASSKLSD